ncbi:MAG: nucleotidyltransferase family protein [Nitrospirae bacterium]|nr:nucleotidyltransferase family protein [Nitrospirota bacterium]MBF0616648.1 nucleotidyltransferase family protein [Nitrospirota bacterium]
MQIIKTIDEIKTIINSNREVLESRFKVKTIGVFGSYVRGAQNKWSDIDILVEFSEPVDLIQFIELENYLAGKLGKKVDLVTKNALKPFIGKCILDEVVYV